MRAGGTDRATPIDNGAFFSTVAGMSQSKWKVAKTYTDILYHKADGIAKVTINRPAKRNAFRQETVSQMYDAFADAIAGPSPARIN